MTASTSQVAEPTVPRLPGRDVGAVVIGGGCQGLGIARSLGRRGIPVCLLDDEISVARASRFVKHAIRVRDLHTEPALLDALALVHDRLGQSGWVLYPTREENIVTIAAQRVKLQQEFRVPTPGLASIRHAWDKRELYRLAERLSIPTPRTWFPRSEADLAAIEIDRPVVLKPAIKEHFFYTTGAKAWRADTLAELRAAFRRAAQIMPAGEIIIQEMIPGDGQQQLAYCALFREGRSVASMTARRCRQHPSDFGVASTYVETVPLPELAEPSRRFLTAIDYYGLVELEYKRDPRDGICKLLDVNPRTWGYHTLGLAAGVDFPYLLFQDQIGAPVTEVHARPGVRWIRLSTDIANAVRDIRSGRLRPGAYLRSLRGIDTEAVFSVADPLPGLYEIALLPYLAAKRGVLSRMRLRSNRCLQRPIRSRSSITSRSPTNFGRWRGLVRRVRRPLCGRSLRRQHAGRPGVPCSGLGHSLRLVARPVSSAATSSAPSRSSAT